MVFCDNIPGNSPGRLYAVMLTYGPGRSGPEAVGGRSDTVPDVLVGGGTWTVVVETVGSVNTGDVTAAETGNVVGGNTGGDHA